MKLELIFGWNALMRDTKLLVYCDSTRKWPFLSFFLQTRESSLPWNPCPSGGGPSMPAPPSYIIPHSAFSKDHTAQNAGRGGQHIHWPTIDHSSLLNPGYFNRMVDIPFTILPNHFYRPKHRTDLTLLQNILKRTMPGSRDEDTATKAFNELKKVQVL